MGFNENPLLKIAIGFYAGWNVLAFIIVFVLLPGNVTRPGLEKEKEKKLMTPFSCRNERENTRRARLTS